MQSLARFAGLGECENAAIARKKRAIIVIPGWSEGPDPESRGAGFASRPGMTLPKAPPAPAPRRAVRSSVVISALDNFQLLRVAFAGHAIDKAMFAGNAA